MSKLKRFQHFLFSFCLAGVILCASGCDVVYRLLQKEGAEEMDLLGEVAAFEASPAVEDVQKLLKLYGYRVGKVDGKLGLNTRNAIEKFQKDNSLEPTRFMDKVTWAKLNMFARSGLVTSGEVNIKKVQEALKNARLDAGAIDGKMGQRTKEAVKAFQKAAGLTADGNIGFKTLSRLDKYLPDQ